MAPRARSISRSRGLPWQPTQPQRHMKPRSIRGKRAFHSGVQAFPSAAGCCKASKYAPVAHPPAAARVLRPFVNHLSMPRVWQPAPHAVHGCGLEHAWPGQRYQQQPQFHHHHRQQQQQQQQQAPKQLKKRVRTARQRRQQRQRRALARQQQKQQPTLFAPPAPLLDNEFYMARAERERQEQGVRQMDFLLYPNAAAAADAGGRQPVMFAPAAPLINNEMLMVRAEQERAEAAALQQQQPQQQTVSSALFAPLTPAVEEQPLVASQVVTAAAVAASPAASQQWQQLEQQLQEVHIQELSCSQQQQQLYSEEEQQQHQDDDDEDYTMEEVCSWFPGVQASLKTTQRVNLPGNVARQPDAPGFFSVLTRTVSDASSCC